MKKYLKAKRTKKMIHPRNKILKGSDGVAPPSNITSAHEITPIVTIDVTIFKAVAMIVLIPKLIRVQRYF